MFSLALVNAAGPNRFRIPLAEGPFPTVERAAAFGKALLTVIRSPYVAAIVLDATGAQAGKIPRVLPETPTAVPADPPETPEPATDPGTDPREAAAIRTGLRLVQLGLKGHVMTRDSFAALLTDGGDLAALEIDEIDALLQRLEEA
jgi:hypothetical protein